MRFRLTLILGLAIGYVLGAKAGRERYDQIMELWQQFQGTETARQVSSLADQAVDTVQAKTSETVDRASEAMNSAGSTGEPTLRPS